MELKLSDDEAVALRTALETYVSDLRMEIRETDKWALRQELKADAKRLEALLDRLRNQPDPITAD